MIRNRQKFRHCPEVNQYGDCHRTAISCLLDLLPDDVPHFYELKVAAEARGEAYDWNTECERFLNSRGYTQCNFLYNCDLDSLFSFMREKNPDALYLLGGQSVRGVNHTVICAGGGFEWDPHPDNRFVGAPLDNGYYEITVLMPIQMKRPATDSAANDGGERAE